MSDLLLFALAGFAASLVDGALGMGFGPTSSSILLGAGLAPSAVSASVNLAKVATGIAGGISHWKFRNIDKTLVLQLALPGVAGAIIGVTVLANVNGATLRPLLAVLLSVVGLRILMRFARPTPGDLALPPVGGEQTIPHYDSRGVRGVALLGGITNGMIGAWGPVVTPFLLHRGLRPRYAVGSVNTAELAVASASAVALVVTVGRGGFNPAIVIAMLTGGVMAAPLAAWMIRHVPARPMGLAVAGLLLLTNARELSAWFGWNTSPVGWLLYLAICALVAGAAFAPTIRSRIVSSV